MTNITKETNTRNWTMPEIELPNIPSNSFTITDFGAVGDGVTDNTEAFRKAIAACTEAGGGKVIIPAGLWLTGPIILASRLELHAQAGATIMFSTNFDDYPLILSTYEGWETVRCTSPLDGEGLEDIAITGPGVFDGGGDAWRYVKKWKLTELQWNKLTKTGVVDGDSWWPTEQGLNGAKLVDRLISEGVKDPKAFEPARDYLRPNLLSLRRCKRLLLDGPTFQNSPAWNVHPWASQHVTLRNLTIRNPWYGQNGDGLDLESCRYALVENCTFDVGDDAICMKSGKDKEGRERGIPSEYIIIRNCIVYHGHGGFVVGSEMSGGVRCVEVSDCTFMGTDIGIRFKTARGRGGVVEDILMKNIRMINIDGEAISFSMFYEGKEGSGTLSEDKHPITDETPVFRNLHMEDIVCTGAEVAFLIKGLVEVPMEGLTLTRYKAIADRGVECTNATNLALTDVDIQVKEGPMVKLHQCNDVRITRMSGCGSESDDRFLVATGNRSDSIVLDGLATCDSHRKIEALNGAEGKVQVK